MVAQLSSDRLRKVDLQHAVRNHQAMPHITPHTIQETAIDGMLRIVQKQVTDERGTVREFFRQSAYTEIDTGPWTQLNVTQTRRGAIRGLHGESTAKPSC